MKILSFLASRRYVYSHIKSLFDEKWKTHSSISAKPNSKLLPRDRIAAIFDAESSFLELSQLAGDQLYGNDLMKCGGIITAVGLVSGKLCMVMCNDYTVKGGAIYPITLKKYLRAQEIALKCNLISIHLTESGGAALPLQSEIFNEGGRNFYNIAKMSSASLPQITVVFGSCTAGNKYDLFFSKLNESKCLLQVFKALHMFLLCPRKM